MIEGYALEVVLTTANSAAQAWYGYDQVREATVNAEILKTNSIQGIIAGILVSDQFLNKFPIVKKPVIEGTFTSIFSVSLALYVPAQSYADTYELGNLIGCLLAALFGDKPGRKNTLRVGAAISTVGAILQFSSTTFAQLMIGRTINRFGNGMTSSTCGVFQAESVRGSRRGKLSVIVVLHNVVFYMLGSWITLGTYWLNNSGQWRVSNLHVRRHTTVSLLVLIVSIGWLEEGVGTLPGSP